MKHTLCLVNNKASKQWRHDNFGSIRKAKLGDVDAYKALMDSAYGGVKQNVEITEGETPIFMQLDIDVIA